MATHYFHPFITFGHEVAPAKLRAVISTWEQGDGPDNPRIVGASARPMPILPAAQPGSSLYRRGRFAADPQISYRLRLEVGTGPRPTTTIGLFFTGPDLPTDETRGGGSLVQDLATTNWRSPPKPEFMPRTIRHADTFKQIREELLPSLLSPHRKVPIVLLTHRSCNDEAIADVHTIRNYLHGMAEVWNISRRDATFALRDGFIDRGFDGRWGCYDGGIRIYMARFKPEEDDLGDHPLLLASSLDRDHEDPSHAAIRWALPYVARALGVDAWTETLRSEMAERPGRTSDFCAPLTDGHQLKLVHARAQLQHRENLTEVESPRPETEAPAEPSPLPSEASKGSEASVPSPASPASPVPPPATPSVTEPTPIHEVSPSAASDTTAAKTGAQGLQTRADQAPTPAQPTASRSPIAKATHNLRDAIDIFANIEELLGEIEDERISLLAECKTLARARDDLSQELQDFQQRDTNEDSTPNTLVEMARFQAKLFEDRLRITKYALRKVSSSNYNNLLLFGQVLAVIALHGTQFGRLNDTLNELFGARARARRRESPHTMKAFGKQRTFPLDNGTSVTTETHITPGHGHANRHKTLQIYLNVPS
ncbi:MAG TPA: hypothetical protein ENJ18_13525, partial [Nannocystis exedens]|nr:hypothetical protein [Nannocystis exedens]